MKSLNIQNNKDIGNLLVLLVTGEDFGLIFCSFHGSFWRAGRRAVRNQSGAFIYIDRSPEPPSEEAP